MKISDAIEIETIKDLCYKQIERTNNAKIDASNIDYSLGAKAMACTILSELNK